MTRRPNIPSDSRPVAKRRSLWAFHSWREPMRSLDDSAHSTPEQRLIHVATILARGLLRLHARSALTPSLPAVSTPEKPPESGQDCLELPG
jgi:hypothetical protein